MGEYYVAYAADAGEYNAHVYGMDKSLDEAKARIQKAIDNGAGGVYNWVAIVNKKGDVIRTVQV